MEARERRAKKLTRAKERIRDMLQKYPTTRQILNPQLETALATSVPSPAAVHPELFRSKKAEARPVRYPPRERKSKKVVKQEAVIKLEHSLNLEWNAVPSMPALDQEDLTIERLLLNGVSDDVILNGYYDADVTLQSINPLPDLDSVFVGEADIPDSEMDKFIRTPAEVEIYSQLRGEQAEEAEQETTKKTNKRTAKKAKKEVVQPSEGDEEEDDWVTEEEEEAEERLQRDKKKPRISA